MVERIFKVLLNLLKLGKVELQDVKVDKNDEEKSAIFIHNKFKPEVSSILTKMGYIADDNPTSSKNLEEAVYAKGDYYIQVDHFKLRNFLHITVHKYVD